MSGIYTMLGTYNGEPYYSNGAYYLYKIGNDFLARLISTGETQADLANNWSIYLSGTDGNVDKIRTNILNAGFGQAVIGNNIVKRATIITNTGMSHSVTYKTHPIRLFTSQNNAFHSDAFSFVARPSVIFENTSGSNYLSIVGGFGYAGHDYYCSDGVYISSIYFPNTKVGNPLPLKGFIYSHTNYPIDMGSVFTFKCYSTSDDGQTFQFDNFFISPGAYFMGVYAEFDTSNYYRVQYHHIDFEGLNTIGGRDFAAGLFVMKINGAVIL